MFLDPNNPRIPPTPQPLTEPELIAELVLHDDVHQLASNIQASGYFPTEPLMIVREDGQFRVAEGNRRLAACKLLVNPDLAPESYKSKFRHLSTTVEAHQFSRIPVVIAPNRESTIPIIIARHTSSQIQRWEPAMQANFYQKLVSTGLPIEEVAKKFNLPASKIKEALHSYNLYQMACRLDLDDKAAEVVRNPRTFSLTTLSRIFESTIGRSILGVELADDGKIVGKISQDEFKKGFRKLVNDVASGKADSRKLNSPADIKGYLDSFVPTDKPDLSKKGSFDSDSFLTTTASTRLQHRRSPRGSKLALESVEV